MPRLLKKNDRPNTIARTAAISVNALSVTRESRTAAAEGGMHKCNARFAQERRHSGGRLRRHPAGAGSKPARPAGRKPALRTQRYNPNVKRDPASNHLTDRYASKDMAYLFSPDFK